MIKLNTLYNESKYIITLNTISTLYIVYKRLLNDYRAKVR